MFDKLLNSRMICIQSDSVHTAASFIDTFIVKRSTVETEFHWFCYDSYSKDLSHELTINSDYNSLFMYDCIPYHSDTLGFVGDKLQRMLSCNAIGDRRYKRITLIIDSISTLLNESSSFENNCLIQELVNWKRRFDDKATYQIIFTLRSEALFNGIKVVKYLERIATVWLIVHYDYFAVKTKKSNGKLTQKVYEWTTDEKGKAIWNQKQSVKLDGKSATLCCDRDNDRSQNNNDTAFCSFKLTLTDQEKKARNAIKLPYERYFNLDNDSHPKSRIVYNPDEHDDWDEEEPDNDLEFI